MKRKKTFYCLQEFTDTTVMIKDGEVNDIAAFAQSVVIPAVSWRLTLKEGVFSSRKGDRYQ